MTKAKISAEELRKLLDRPDVTMEQVAPYLKVVADEADGLLPKVVFDMEKIDLGKTEEARRRAALAIPFFNIWVRTWRRGAFDQKMASGYDGPIIVAEGDSWFTYPNLDVVGALNDHFAILHLAGAGHTLAEMLEQDEYLEETQRVGAKILMLSGGGNDALASGRLAEVLRRYDKSISPAQHIKSSFGGLVDDAMRRYDQIFRRVAREAPGVVAICHAYDYAIPAKGKWLGQPMEGLGIVDPAFQRAIVREMIGRFSSALGRLAERHPHVVFLNTPGTVGEKDWADELHPNPAGFRKVAEKFEAAIRQAAARARSPAAAPGGKGKRRKADPVAAPARRRGLKPPTGLNRGLSLHIGLNEVDPQHYGGKQELFGCRNDAAAMEQIARESGYEVMGVLLDGEARAKAVVDAIGEAAKKLKAGDIFLLTYAGHGSQREDKSGDERDDGMDETWCLYDRMLIDDELYALWRRFKEGVRVLVVSDSCHSGTVIRATSAGLARTDAAALGERVRVLPREVRIDVQSRHRAFYAEIERQVEGAGTLLSRRNRAVASPLDCSVRLLSGCQDNQVARDGDLNGLFTSRLLQVLERGFRGDYDAFHKAICDQMPMDQTPNHWTVGRRDAVFDGQQPFEI